MPIEVGVVKAVCVDCGEDLTGTLIINVWDFARVTTLGTATGSVVWPCITHHDERREWGDGGKNKPQHSDFNVFRDERLIGELRVATMALEHRFVIRDSTIAEDFAEEIRALQRQHRQLWRY